MNHLDDIDILREVMKERDSVVDQVKLVKSSVVSNQVNIRTHCSNVVPETKVLATKWEVEHVGIINTQRSGSIFKDLSLINEVSADSITLKGVVGRGLKRNIVLKVVNLVLVDEIVELLVHALHHVVLWSCTILNFNLKHCCFNVFFQVPGDNDHNLSLHVFGHDLDVLSL